jgi:hypothetical protein
MSKIVFLFSIVLLFSCSKSSSINRSDLEICAFIQEKISNEYSDAQYYTSELKSLYMTSNFNSNPSFHNKIKSVIEATAEIDNLSNKRLLELDQIKVDIFKKLKLDVNVDKRTACSVYDFSKVNLNSTTSDVDDFKKNKDLFFKENLKLINEMMRVYLMSHPRSENQINFKEINIEVFSNYEELNNLVSKEINQMNLPNDCIDVVIYYYTQALTSKKQFDESVESMDNWVSLFNYISKFQIKILESKALLYADLKSNFGSCDFNFDKIEIVVNGPDKVRLGEEIKLKVFNAAINTEEQPVVKTQGNISVENGVATIINKATKKGPLTIKGTLSYRNKSGEIQTKNWSKEIIVD